LLVAVLAADKMVAELEVSAAVELAEETPTVVGVLLEQSPLVVVEVVEKTLVMAKQEMVVLEWL
jgi:hypothetical protein|tara:strand:- start:625 stop:816 length:192 start_codon:yes stop_codon:yes gene_type:complete